MLGALGAERGAGNGQGRKLSQLGTHVCGNRKEPRCPRAAGCGGCAVPWAGGRPGGALPEPPDVPL